MRLPDITYGEVRPLVKQSDDYVKRGTQTEINLSRAALGAELDKAGKIGQSGINLAREKLSADRGPHRTAEAFCRILI